MSYVLLRTGAFIRAASRFVSKHPERADKIRITLELMEQDVFDPRLKAHRLKGPLEGAYACSGGYDMRIVFKLVEHEGSRAILLLSIGTHDEVY